MSNTPAPRLQTREVLNDAVRARAQRARQTATTEKDSISTNPFAVIMYNPALDPEQKKAEIAKLATAASTREECEARDKAITEFSEHINAVCEEMQREIMALTDTETFAELQQIYDELNGTLDEWGGMVKPFTDMLAGIHKLRTNDKTTDAYREIQTDKSAREERERRRDLLRREFDTIEINIQAHQERIAELGEHKAFFGFGGVKQEAREEIAQRNLDIERLAGNLADKGAALTLLDTETAPMSTLSPEFADAKEQLARLLSNQDHIQAQKDLVSKTVELVDKVKRGTGRGRELLGRMDKQYNRLKHANRDITYVVAVLSDAIAEAEKKSHEIRAEYETAPENESAIAKMQREDRRLLVEDHLKALANRLKESIEMSGDLAKEAVQLTSGKGAIEAQANAMRVMNTRGVAATASQLNTVLSAVNAAALNEATEANRAALIRINAETNAIAQQEVVRQAIDTKELNTDLTRALDELASYSEVYRDASAITNENMREVRENLNKLKSLKEEVLTDIKDASADQADISADGPKTDDPEPAAKFGL